MTPERTVHYVDDDDAVRTALAGLLRHHGFTVREFASGEGFLAAVPGLPDGPVLLDLRMPGMSGLEVQAALQAARTTMPLIFLTAHGDVPTGVAAMKSGARDFLEKPVREEALLAAVNAAFETMHASHVRREAARRARARLETVTPREREVIELVVAGLRSKAIAARLGISYQTVKVHRMRAMEKLGTETLPELSRLWSEATQED